MKKLLSCHPKSALLSGKRRHIIAGLGLALLFVGEAAAQSTFGGNAQHTANYTPKAQSLNAVHWTTAIDLNNTGGYAHYGAPLLTPANTIFVPVKTGATDGYQVNVFNASNGSALYTLSTDYTQPSHNWILPYQPVLATNSVETRLYYPGAGGTVYYINNVDSATHGTPVQQAFYASLSTYRANSAGFNSTIFIDTPITADASGNIFFGFRVSGTAPAPLNTTQSGYARIDPNGVGTYVLAGTAAGDGNIGSDTHNCAPALSNDQSTVYVAVKSSSSETYGYLLGLDATTLATKYKIFLKDPRNNNANNATILDDSTASPMVGPDGDVYFGIYGNPANGSRGFMLHFSANLTEKTPGGFGWDNTVAVVPASMVPSYTGSSTYLLFSKYNNYAGAGSDSADGINRVAVLDPNATEVDAHASSNGLLIMREVLTAIGPTPDKENVSPSLPYAVREWCINTAAVNPATGNVYFPSEDGHIYGWNLTSNSLAQFLQLNIGVGLPYVPTVIGPDGQVYTLNGGTLSAIGSLNGVGIAITSSAPDVRNTVAGQQVTFTVAVSNTGSSGLTPTGTVTVTDTTYSVPSPNVLNSSTATLGSNVALDGTGHASVSSSTLAATKHFITATYSGDANFSPGSASLIQYVHVSGSTTTLKSSANPSTPGQSVVFTATVASLSGTPTGQVTFQDGTTVLAQAPVNSSGNVTYSTSTLAAGSHTVTATYASDTNFSASSGSVIQSVQTSSNSTSTSVSSSPNPSVFGQSVMFTSTTTSTGGAPSGTVTFTEGSTVLASNVAVDGAGHASFSTSALAVGSHTITAAFTGATGWGNSSGNGAPQVVNAAGSSVTLGSSTNPSVFGQTITLSATVSASAPGGGVPSGTVTFKNGSTTLGSGTLNGSGLATLATSALAVGSASLTAVYGGSTNFAGSTSAILTQVVNADGTTTALSSSANPSVYGQSVTFTATVTAAAPGSGVPTGTVTFSNGSTTLGTSNLNGARQATLSLSTLAVGPASITASYNGDANFKGSASGALSQTVNKDGSTTTLGSSANPSISGQPVTFTATVTASAPGSGLPTGSVTFKNGSATLGSSNLDGAGHAALTTSALPLGANSITASYAGDTNFTTSTSTVLTQTVNNNGSTTALSSSANPSVFSQPVTFTATVTGSGSGTPTGSVTFKNGSTTLGSSGLSGGQASLTVSTLAVGTASITATYSGDATFSGSTSAPLSQVVHQAQTTTTVASSLNPSNHNTSVTFTAQVGVMAPGTAIPTGTVTFKNGARNLGTGTLNALGQATFTISNLQKGTNQITAVYGGTTSFAASTSIILMQTVN